MKLIFLFCFCSALSYGDLVDHLKKPGEKSGNHSLRNIDFIYMINLDQRPEKFKQASQELQPYGIHPFRFSAVNGWELSIETINEVGLKYQPGMTSLFATSFPFEAGGRHSNGFMNEFGQAYFSHAMPRGSIGICLSHISILKDAWDSGYQLIWVLEDDVVAVQDPRMVPELIDRLDALVGRANWDVLFTDPDTKSSDGSYIPAYGVSKRPDMDCSYEERFSEKYTACEQISPDFKKITARFGAYSMLLTRTGIKKLLDFALEHKIYNPYDFDNYQIADLRRYSTMYDVVVPLVGALSDNGARGYSQETTNLAKSRSMLRRSSSHPLPEVP